MRKNLTVHEIVKTWLKDNGYHGLYNRWERCGCTTDKLMPYCGRLDEEICCAGWIGRYMDGDGDWVDGIVAKKEVLDGQAQETPSGS